MSAKLFSRSGAFVWAPRGVQVKGLLVGDFAQYYDPNNPAQIDFFDKEKLLEQNVAPSASASTNYRFNELTWWSECSEAHPEGVIAGGTQNGTVAFFDAHKLVKENRLEVLSSCEVPQGHVLSVDTACDSCYIASGGSNGDILLWDPRNLSQPFTAGVPNTQDQIKSVRWNRVAGSVFASITSRNLSIWDFRIPTAPTFVLNEVPYCDWSSVCWHPTDANYLMVGSQSKQCSAIHQYDVRSMVKPVHIYNHHENGVTSIDWHKHDSRLLMSSGCDGKVFIWSQETSQVLGGVGSLQDWIRNVKWNESEPDQFAIQFYRNNIQLGSLATLGTPQPNTEVFAPRVDEQFVPEWRRAPSASVALGARMVTLSKSVDPVTGKLTDKVEVEKIQTENDVGADQMDHYLAVRHNKRELGWFLQNRSTIKTISEEGEDEDGERMVYLAILGLMSENGRSKMLSYLGITNNDDDVFEPNTKSSTSALTTTATTATGATRSAISSTSSSMGTEMSTSTTETVHLETNAIERCAGVEWDQLGDSGWKLFHKVFCKDHLSVIRILLDSNQHVAAMMYAAKNASEHIPMIFDHYNKATPNPHPLSSLTSVFSFDTPSASEDLVAQIDQILKTFPEEKWKELIGLLIAQNMAPDELRSCLRYLGAWWFEMGKSLRACVCFIVAGDVDGLLWANSLFSMGDRAIQGLVLHDYLNKNTLPIDLDKLLITYSDMLMANDDTLTAWNMLKGVRNGSSDLQKSQWAAWEMAGKEEGTGDRAPFALYDVDGVSPEKSSNKTSPRPPSNTLAPPKRDVMRQNPSMNYNQYQQVPTQPPPPTPPPTTSSTLHVYNNRNGAMAQPINSRTPLLPQAQQAYQAPTINSRTPLLQPTPPMNSNFAPNPPAHQAPPMSQKIAPMPPSSTFYPTPSWNHQPQPAMPPNMPPPKPAAPVTAGWNDPPPGMFLARQTPPTVAKPNVMEMTWKPAAVAPAPGGMMAPVQQMQGMNLRSLPSTASSSVLSSPSLVVQSPPPAQLSPEDEQLMAPFYTVLDQVVEKANTEGKIVRANELRARIKERLEAKLPDKEAISDVTRHYLRNLGSNLSIRNFEEAKNIIGQMAQNKADFYSVSTFLPSLRSLCSLAH